jgi:hypothetical protein
MKTRYFWSTVAASPRPKTVPVALLAISASRAIPAERPAIFECRCAMLAGSGV